MYNFRFIFLFICMAGVLIADDNSSVEAEIRQFVDLFVRKWNDHNPKELSTLWAENGDLMNPAGEWEKGRSNVLKILTREHQSVLRQSKMKQEVNNILVLSPTMAWVDSKVSISMPEITEGLDHHIVYLLTKQDNQWRILAARPYQFLELHLQFFESPHAINKENS